MPDVGWYPDPAGTPGRYRYWDGSRWSSVTTDDPRRAGPAKPAASGSTATQPAKDGPPGQPSRKRRLSLIIGVLAVSLLAIVASAIFVGNFRSVVDNPIATPSVSGTEDSSPSGTPTSTTTPSATPTAIPQAPPCPTGNPNQRARHPNDGRVYGGNLSFEAQPMFESAAVEPRFSFAYDVLQQTRQVSQTPPWIAQLAVGQLRRKDGFVGDAQNTLERLVQCVIIGNMYGPYVPTRTDIRSESLSIDGRSGWLIESEITVDRPDVQVGGDHVIFIVVRDGRDWGFFFGAVPVGDAQLDAVLARAARGLRAS